VQRARAQRLGEGPLEPREPCDGPAREPDELGQLDPQAGDGRFALGTTLIEGTRRELPPDAGIYQQQSPAERDVVRLRGSALDEERVVGPRQRRDGLIHDAALHPHVIMLGTERHACDLPRRE